MNTEFKPKIEYFNWILLIVFLIIFVVFGKLNLYGGLGLLVLYSLIIFDFISRSNSLTINDKKILIKGYVFGIVKEIEIIELKDVRQITLRNPYRIRGIRLLFVDKHFRSFRCNLRKSDLRQFGECIKSQTTIEILNEGYFKTEKL